MEISNKILYHHNGTLLPSIIFPGSEKYINLVELTLAITPRSRGIVSDRTKTFQGRYKLDSPPLPIIPNNFTKTFEDICNERAIELVNTNKQLLVTWSGGIDSTTVLVSLLKANPQQDQIKVIFERKSIEENPQFFYNFIENKLQYQVTDQYWPLLCKPQENQLIVTGDGIPQLFGSTWVANYPQRDINWKQYVNSKLRTTQQNKDLIIGKIELLMNLCPFPITTVRDFVWWNVFCTRTVSWSTRIISNHTSFTSEQYQQLKFFFHTADFELWSIFNHDKKIKTTNESFKYVMKDIIYAFDHNQEYNDTMISKPSSGRSRSRDVKYNTNIAVMQKIKNNELPLIIDNNFKYFFYRDIINNRSSFEKVFNALNNGEWLPYSYIIND
jgi:hypothetical protein